MITADIAVTETGPLECTAHYLPTPLDEVTEISVPEGTAEYSDSSDDEIRDDELDRITEANRHIAPSQKHSSVASTVRSQAIAMRRDLLVFAENPSEVTKSDRLIVYNKYGAGLSGELDPKYKASTKKRSYLVACNLTEESMHAIEWTMGTMLRDGDCLYVVAVVNREETTDMIKKSSLKELQKASDRLTEESKKMMNQMLLFDIDLITYAISGRVRESLLKLIWELPLTMIVCGSRGRSTVKGLLMGSISTYLVHHSPVPVTVIRPEKKNKRTSTSKSPVTPISIENV